MKIIAKISRLAEWYVSIKRVCVCNRHVPCRITNMWCANIPNVDVRFTCSRCTQFHALHIYSVCRFIHTTVAVHTCIHFFKFLLFLHKQLLFLYSILEYQLWHIYMYIILQHVFLCIHVHTMTIIYIVFIEHICLYRYTFLATCLFMYIDIQN